ncbi:MAG: hypothetical protein K1X94_19175 [Sandaracinaceae bacterium]|nr:hypothetical protein [Sandaracinaceae bacterium]
MRPSLAATLVVLVVALLALGAPRSIAAQAPGSEREARALFEQGLHAAEQARWADALELFRRSRAIVERPSVLYNEAQVLVHLSRFVEARDALRAFVGAAHDSRSEADRERLERARSLLNEVQQQIASLVLRVEPADATVEVDGETSALHGPVRTLELDPGRHAITVRATGRDPRSFGVALLSGTRTTETVTLAESSATRLVVEPGDDAARVEVDGEIIGTGHTETSLSGGAHHVRVVPDEGPARERDVEIAPGTTLTVDLGGASTAGSDDALVVALSITGVAVVIGAAVAIGLAVYDPGVEAPISGQVGPGGVVSALTIAF